MLVLQPAILACGTRKARIARRRVHARIDQMKLRCIRAIETHLFRSEAEYAGCICAPKQCLRQSSRATSGRVLIRCSESFCTTQIQIEVIVDEPNFSSPEVNH